ncbi:hypothetical protein [Luteipulveratus flavus]|uniref:DUF4352 domain-containing protein n=1 Tax=Luteipulveratus flavus TaxID=3031728 RepID=A0ABT6C5W6_9MICO|nr:hypothetical protein [Luteipulveratus sp. YIM 133296]MDF8264334.1 hypothetical protein [Luteipulveratus sp. YIM 133296]
MKVMIAVLTAVAASVALSGCGGGSSSAPTSQAAVTVNATHDAPTATPSDVGVSPFGEARASTTGATVMLEKPRLVALKDDDVDHSRKYADVRITLSNSSKDPFPSSDVSFQGMCGGKKATSPKADIGEAGLAYGPVSRYVQPGREVHFRLVYACDEIESLTVSASMAEGTFATFGSS